MIGRLTKNPLDQQPKRKISLLGGGGANLTENLLMAEWLGKRKEGIGFRRGCKWKGEEAGQ